MRIQWFCWNFQRTAIVFTILAIAIVDANRETESKAIDFVILVDRSPPELYYWRPSDSMVSSSADTNKIHNWVQQLLTKLLEEAQTKAVNARISVYIIHKLNVTKEAEFYSADHVPSKQYTLHGLKFAYVRRYRDRAYDRGIIQTAIENATAIDTPPDRMGVPRIFIWHVPYDGINRSAIRDWRTHHLTGDAMVSMEDYWDTNKVNGTRLVIDHVLAQEPYNIQWKQGDPKLQQPLVDDIWNITSSCRVKITYSKCYYSASRACLVDKSYAAEAKEGKQVRFCTRMKNATKVVECDYGQKECEQMCLQVGEEGPCSVTCGQGTKVHRPPASKDKYTEHCRAMNATCLGPPCNQSGETEKPTYWLDNETAPSASVKTSTSVSAFVIALSSVGGAAVLAAVIGVAICCACREKRPRLLHSHGPGRGYGQSGRSRSLGGHTHGPGEPKSRAGSFISRRFYKQRSRAQISKKGRDDTRRPHYLEVVSTQIEQ